MKAHRDRSSGRIYPEKVLYAKDLLPARVTISFIHYTLDLNVSQFFTLHKFINSTEDSETFFLMHDIQKEKMKRKLYITFPDEHIYHEN